MPSSTRTLKRQAPKRPTPPPDIDGSIPYAIDAEGRYVFPHPLEAHEVLSVAEAICAARLYREGQAHKPDDLIQYLLMKLSTREHEVFGIVYFDVRLQILGFEELFRGTTAATVVFPNQVARQALLWSAHAVALVHNHPTGSPTPSVEDQRLTSRLIDALRAIEVKVIDHLIVAGITVTSMAALGMCS